MSFRVTGTKLPGVMLLRTDPARDDRGSFARISCVETLAGHGIAFAPRQTSISRSHRRGTLRGMHFQIAPAAETKIVHCIAGTVFDAIVDLRPVSPTFRECFSVTLDAADATGVIVPPGCAHGVLTLSDDAAVLYQIDTGYAPDLARGVRWNDPAFAIDWPMMPAVISPRDGAWPDFSP